IRDFHVTGVQTCALPISLTSLASIVAVTCFSRMRKVPRGVDLVVFGSPMPSCPVEINVTKTGLSPSYRVSVCLMIEMSIHFVLRSEERRVGKACRDQY